MSMHSIFSSLRGLQDKAVKWFVVLVVLYNGVVAVLNIFMNTFLLGSLGTREVLLYNLTLAIIQPFAMLTALSLARKGSYLLTQRIGFVFYIIVFIFLSIFAARISSLYWLFGILISFGAGYFFTVYSIQMLKYANDSNRDVIQGATTVFASVLCILLPVLSGVIIKYMGEGPGYKIVFGIVALVVVAAILSSYRLPSVGKKEDDTSVIYVAKHMLGDPCGRKILFASCIDNGRTFTLGFFIPVILTLIDKDPMLVSINSAIGSIAGIVASVVYGLIVNKDNRVKSIVYASIISIIACSMLWFVYSAVTVIIFATVFTVTTSFIAFPILSTHFKVVDSIKEISQFGAEVHIVRELFVTLGRAIGVALIFLIPQTNSGIVLVIFILLSLNFISAAIVRNVEKSSANIS